METIIVEKHWRDNQHLTLIRINRPKVLNALNNTVMQEIVQTLEELEKANDHYLTILTGDDRAFAAGADIASMKDDSAVDQYLGTRAQLWKRFNLIRKPIIAAVNGLCLGGGNELAMACDLIIAGDQAKFGQPEIKLGLMPGAGGTQRLVKAIGKARAMRLCLTGEMINAETAFSWGLLSKVVPANTLLQETFEMAKSICQQPPLAGRMIKESVNHSFESSLAQGLDFERRLFYLTFATQDQKEGINAFLEKRQPQFKGQ